MTDRKSLSCLYWEFFDKFYKSSNSCTWKVCCGCSSCNECPLINSMKSLNLNFSGGLSAAGCFQRVQLFLLLLLLLSLLHLFLHFQLSHINMAETQMTYNTLFDCVVYHNTIWIVELSLTAVF